MRTYYGDAFDALAAWGYCQDGDRRPAIRAERPALCAPRPGERPIRQPRIPVERVGKNEEGRA